MTRPAVRAWARRVLAGWVTALLLMAGFPGVAAAHGGVLKSSNPADGANVAALATLELRFSTPVLAEYSQFALTDTTGTTTTVASEFTADNRSVTLTPGAALAAGGYRLAYRVVADDGHPSTGSIGFTIGDTPATPPPKPTIAPPSQPGLLSRDRFATDRALPWVLAGTGALIVAGFAYLLTRTRRDR